MLNHKVSFAASTVQELRDALQAVLEKSPLSVSRTGMESSTNYLGIFTGQGAQVRTLLPLRPCPPGYVLLQADADVPGLSGHEWANS